jgi:hypothetical protein
MAEQKKLKSAYEIALEKLRRKDGEAGGGAPAALTAEQKKEIASIRSKHEARLAESEILFRSERMKYLEDAEALAKAEEAHRLERRKIEAQRDREIAAVHERAHRGGKA